MSEKKSTSSLKVAVQNNKKEERPSERKRPTVANRSMSISLGGAAAKPQSAPAKPKSKTAATPKKKSAVKTKAKPTTTAGKPKAKSTITTAKPRVPASKKKSAPKKRALQKAVVQKPRTLDPGNPRVLDNGFLKGSLFRSTFFL